jgi:hypothetical protein
MDIVTLPLFPPLFQHPSLVYDLGGRHRKCGRHGTEFRVTWVYGSFPIRLPWGDLPGRTRPGRTRTRCGGKAKRTEIGLLEGTLLEVDGTKIGIAAFQLRHTAD